MAFGGDINFAATMRKPDIRKNVNSADLQLAEERNKKWNKSMPMKNLSLPKIRHTPTSLMLRHTAHFGIVVTDHGST
jgi:hypothetical protein